MKKILITFLFTLLMSEISHAGSKNDFIRNDDWHFFFKLSNGSAVYVKGIVKNGNIYSAWYKTEKGESSKCNSASFFQDPLEKVYCKEIVSKSMEYTQIDCGKYAMRTTQVVAYNSNGEVISHQKYNSKAWDDVIPDSAGEYMVTEICRK